MGRNLVQATISPPAQHRPVLQPPARSEVALHQDAFVLDRRSRLPDEFWQSDLLRRSAIDLAPMATHVSDRPQRQAQAPRVDMDRARLIRHLSGVDPQPKVGDRFLLVGKWTGIVVEIGHDRFWATLTNVRRRDTEELEGEFPVEEVAEVDLDLLREGAEFYWAVGYRLDRSGQRSRFSQLRFRRLPRWSEEEVERAREGANAIVTLAPVR